MKTAKLPALTSLRFLAAISIVLLHSAPLFCSPVVLETMGSVQAVSFFFVLSGFVLAYAYPAFRSRERVYLFYITRLARIWPAHIATALWALLLTPRPSWLSPPSVGLVVLNLFMLHAWIPLRNVLESLNAVSWFLTVEIFFCACFPLIIRQWSQRWHWWLAGSALLAVMMVSLSNAFGVPRDEMTPGVSVLGTVYMYPFARLFECILGMAAASVYRYIAPRIEWTRVQATVVEVGTIFFGIFILRLCMVNVQGSWLGEAGQYYILRQGGSFVWTVAIVVFAIGRGGVAWLLANRLAMRLGELSFSLYLVHQLVLRYFELFKAAIARHPFLWHGSYWAATLVAAYAVFTGVEQPMKEVLVAAAKRALRQEPDSEWPSLSALVKPMAMGAVMIAGLTAVAYGARFYILAGR